MMATQPFNFDVFIKGPLTVGTELIPTQIKATLHVEQPQNETVELARFVRTVGAGPDSVGLKVDLPGGVPNLQGLTVADVAGPLTLNQAGGDLQLGSAASQIAIPGTLTVAETINGRKIGDDGAHLDAHLADMNNPHGVTAALLGALSSLNSVSHPGGNINLVSSGAITITPDAAQKQITIGETHSTKTDNPHNTTAAQVKALSLDGGAIAGALTVKGSLSADILRVQGQNCQVGIGPVNLEAGKRLMISSGHGEWLLLQQERSTEAGAFLIHNPWRETDGAKRNRLEIGYRPGGPEQQDKIKWGLLTIHGPSGNVGIGEAEPSAKLHVAGALRTDGVIQLRNSDGGYAVLSGKTYDNEEKFNHNNVKLVLGAIGPAVLPLPPPPEYEFMIGHEVSRYKRIDGLNFGSVTSFVKKFSVNQDGTLYVAGAKTGYVVDYFVNKVGERLEQGDVVVISARQPEYYSGTDNNVPLIEVDLTQTAYDKRVCGIVAKATTTFDLPYVEVEQTALPTDRGQALSEQQSPAAAMPAMKNLAPIDEADRHPLQHLAATASTDYDGTLVEADHIGIMVTLGAFAHCKADADIAPIMVGDLLTTSPTRGHAQKVLAPANAIGAIIGKALGRLDHGKGQIPVLVLLQ